MTWLRILFFLKPDVKRVKRVTNVLSWRGYLRGSSKEKIYSGRPGPYYTRGFPCGQPGWGLLTRSVTFVKTAYYRAMVENEREREREREKELSLSAEIAL